MNVLNLSLTIASVFPTLSLVVFRVSAVKPHPMKGLVVPSVTLLYGDALNVLPPPVQQNSDRIIQL